MKYSERPATLKRRAHLVSLLFGCFCLAILSMPKVGYSAAIMVKQTIDLHDNNITVDSYNSSDPTKSFDGQWSASVSGSDGDVVCINGITNSAPIYSSSVGNMNIYGRAYIASGSSLDIGTNGFIGTHAWSLTNTGAEPGYLVPNTNFVFPSVTLPDYSGFLGPVIPGGTVVTTNLQNAPYIYFATNYYDNVICGNYFTTNTLGNTVVTCPSILVLPHGYSIGSLTIASGASLTIYVGGASSMTMAANQVQILSGLSSGLVIYCTSDMTNLSFSGNAAFSGVVIAPNANARFNGAGNNASDFSGALIANSLTLNGHFNFHFDEALLQQGIVPLSPSLAAGLMSPALSSSGQFQFNVTGVPGFSYVVESSSNLTDWLAVFTNASPFTFTDTNGSAAGQNFYRAVYYQQ